MRTTLLTVIGLATTAILANTPPAITNVRASQREGTKLVDIYYDAADADNDLLKVRIEISDNDGARYSVPAFSLMGDIGEGIVPGTNKHIVWDAGTDWDGEYSDQMRVKVFAIDAQGFPGMEWGNEVPPGGFLMGQDGGAEGSGPSRHVNIPWSYWLSKYEITNEQYCDFLNAALAAGVVEREGTTAVYSKMGTRVIPYTEGRYLMLNIGDNYDIRWNVNNFEVVNGLTNYPVRVSWYGAMMFAHFYGYDLPTEAEWEKAARGPDNDDQDEHLLFPWGNEITAANANVNSDLTKPVGYYNGNQTPIGGDMVNGYGLYDVIGNAAEWTLTAYDYGIETYPLQESLASYRNLQTTGYAIVRGCTFGNFSYQFSTYYRGEGSRTDGGVGFRVVRRDSVERPNVYRITESFDEWDLSEGSYLSYSTGNQSWSGGYYRVAGGVNGSAGVVLSGSGLFLPSVSNVVCITFKARNVSQDYDVSLWVNSSQGRSSYRSLPRNMTDFINCQFEVPIHKDDTYSIVANFYDCVYIDDLEIRTIPQACE